MKKILFCGLAASLIIISCKNLGSTLVKLNHSIKLKHVDRIVYFDPEVYPNFEEIKEPTNNVIYSSVSDELKNYGNYKIMHINNANIKYDSVDVNMIKESCLNNGAEIALVPKVKYFKVGLGKYVFSNQVIVSMKMYNNDGELVIENSYDTYKGNGRLLGTAENSVIIGTKGALRKISKELKNRSASTHKPI